MDIQERIDQIKPYFKNMNVVDNIIYIELNFPKKWSISDFIVDNFNTKAVQSNCAGDYYFYCSFDDGFEKIFDAIDYTIKFNKQAEEKIQLLLSKIEELKQIFEEEDINVLKTIEFKYKKKKNKVSKIAKLTNVKDNIVIKNEENMIETNVIEVANEEIANDVTNDNKN